MRNSATRYQISICIVVWCCLGIFSHSNGDETGSGKTKSTKSAKAAKAVQAKTLAPLLKSQSEELWDKGIARVTPESLENDEIFKLVIQFVNRELSLNRFSSGLAKAIPLLGNAKQPEAAELLAKLLTSDDYRVVMVTADTVSTTLKRDLIEPLMKLPERRDFAEHYGFRRCVMDAVAHFREKTALDFLVKHLGSSDGQLKYEIAMSLQQATGQQFGGVSGDWRNWWKTNRDTFEFGRSWTAQPVTLKAPPKQIPWEESRPNFYGMPIYAKRIVFIIDRSGSMGMAAGEETRLEKAQREIQRAIMALSESDSFNLVAFDDRMDVFKVRLMPATEYNKLEGIQFAFGLNPRGATACYEPLKMGLEASNDLEAIFFVSDGEPTSGALVDPTAIVLAIANHNLTQRTTINALGIDAQGPHESFLKNLAEKNYGKLLMIK